MLQQGASSGGRERAKKDQLYASSPFPNLLQLSQGLLSVLYVELLSKVVFGRKVSATEKIKVDHLCFRTQVKTSNKRATVFIDGNKHFNPISSAAFYCARVICLGKKIKPNTGNCLLKVSFQIVHLAKDCMKLNMTLIFTLLSPNNQALFSCLNRSLDYSLLV